MSQKNLSVRLASRTQVFPEKSSETIVTEASQCAVQPIKRRKPVMKAAVIDQKNSIHLNEIAVPEIREGEALIRVRYCGICGSDLHVLHGQHPTAKFPVVPGHEFVGELVEAKGMGADKFQPGDMVVAQPFFSCGNCEPCAQGNDNVCRDLHFMGTRVNGGFAEYVKVLTRKMYRLSKGMDLRLAAYHSQSTCFCRTPVENDNSLLPDDPHQQR